MEIPPPLSLPASPSRNPQGGTYSSRSRRVWKSCHDRVVSRFPERSLKINKKKKVTVDNSSCTQPYHVHRAHCPPRWGGCQAVYDPSLGFKIRDFNEGKSKWKLLVLLFFFFPKGKNDLDPAVMLRKKTQTEQDMSDSCS